MPQFQYKSADPYGEPESGFIEAADEVAARELLAARGIVVASIELATAEQSSPQARKQSGHTSMTTDEHVEVLGQVGNLISAGIPLSAGLRTLSEEVPSRRLRGVFDRLSDKLDRGDSLEDAMISESRDMPEWLAAVFAAGTRSGRLPECIQHFITFSRMRSGMRAKLIISLVYPAILLAVGLAVSGVLCVFLIPDFKDIFYGFEVELPAITEMLINVSSLVENAARDWPQHLLGFAVVILVAWLISKSIFGAAGVRRVLYRVPLLGRVFKLSALAEFSQLLALLIEARTPLHEALRLVGGAVRDPNLSEGACRAARHIENGESFASLRGVIHEIPDELLRIPGWGSNDVTLIESLRVSSEVFALQSEISGRGFVGAITPFSVILAGCMITLTVLGLFLPLVKLLNDLS
ncbi:MAG: type II secretion system F family protein [Planctomycetota bacterium]|nr:type II secretion system F family protein [Planctomycetota bacterium]